MTYHAVAEDLKIFRSNDWPTFYTKTNLTCNRIRPFTDGFLTKDDTARIYIHERYLFNFIIKKDKIELVGEDEITYFDVESEQDEEHTHKIDKYNDHHTN